MLNMGIYRKICGVMLSAALGAAVLTGCATVETSTEGTRVLKDQVRLIEPGVTTRQEAIEIFGEPDKVTMTNTMEKLIYTHSEKARRSYFGGMVEDQTRDGGTTTTLELTVRDGIVWSYSFESSDN